MHSEMESCKGGLLGAAVWDPKCCDPFLIGCCERELILFHCLRTLSGPRGNRFWLALLFGPDQFDEWFRRLSERKPTCPKESLNC